MVDWSSKCLKIFSTTGPTPALVSCPVLVFYGIRCIVVIWASGSKTSSAFTTVHEGASLFGDLLLFLFSLHYITLGAMVDDTRAIHPSIHPLGAPSSVSYFSINNNTFRHATPSIQCQSLCPFRVLSIRAIVCGRGAFHPTIPICLYGLHILQCTEYTCTTRLHSRL